MSAARKSGPAKAGVAEVRRGFCGTVGGTPLIRLGRLSEATGCEILGKAEFLNPGGSVKDRAGLAIIEDGERRGLLKPGGTVVEGSAGNTGIGLALVANAKGYRCIVVIPDTQSPEKMALLRAMGAEVRAVPQAPYPEPANYNKIAERLAGEIRGGFWANQFDNLANREMHYRTTGPEIWRQTGGAVTAFVAAVGTGGTLAGTSLFLKERSPAIRTVCADPYGSVTYSWIKTKTLDDEGDSITEGIGQGRVTKNLEGAPVDDAYRISDQTAIEMLYHLAREEGLLLGSSSAINVCGAVKLARERGRGQVIVTILADGGQRYLSRLYNPAWLAEKGLTPKAKGLEFLDRL